MACEEEIVPYREGIHAPEEYIEDLFALFWPDGEVPLSIETRLPKFLVEGSFFKDISKVKKACYSWEEASSQEKEFFRKFVEGEVISRKEADWTSSLFIQFCAWLTLPVEGWRELRQVILLLNQHGRLTQPWGARMLKWVDDKIPNVQAPEVNVAAAA